MGTLRQQMSMENLGSAYSDSNGAGPSNAPQRSAGSGSREPANQGPPAPPTLGDASFDILDWHPAYQSCQQYFLDHAQHEPATQALCALINIRLPFQYLKDPVTSSTPQNSSTSTQNQTYQFNFPRPGGSSSVQSPNRSRAGSDQPPPVFISLVPYIKRLIVTGFDKPAILHGLFGDDYSRGVLPHLECERRNYLFSAKHGGWTSCKREYDTGSGMGGDESVPFMKPLEEAKADELNGAEKAWTSWIAMEHWLPELPSTQSHEQVNRRKPDEVFAGSTAAAESSAAAMSAGPIHSAQVQNSRDGTQLLPDGVEEAIEEPSRS